jgi:uncharacterized protein YjeT (DUF2065 family)
VAEPLASIVDDHAVDPHAAAAALARLAQRTRDAVVAAVMALAVGLALVLLGYQEIALPACAAGLTGFFVAAARAANRMASVEHRHELARALSRLVLVAEGIEPASGGVDGIAARILPHADDLLGLAFLIASDGVKVHPASIALLDRLLGSTVRSPLYSSVIPEAHLRIAIQRLRASIDA